MRFSRSVLYLLSCSEPGVICPALPAVLRHGMAGMAPEARKEMGPWACTRPALLLSLPLAGPLWPAGFGVIALLADPKVTRPLQWIQLHVLGLNTALLTGRKAQIPGRRKAVSHVSCARPDHFVSQLFFAPQNIQGL